MNISILVKTIDDLVARVEKLEAIQKANDPVGYAGFTPSVDVRGSDALGVTNGSEESVSNLNKSRYPFEL